MINGSGFETFDMRLRPATDNCRSGKRGVRCQGRASAGGSALRREGRSPLSRKSGIGSGRRTEIVRPINGRMARKRLDPLRAGRALCGGLNGAGLTLERFPNEVVKAVALPSGGAL